MTIQTQLREIGLTKSEVTVYLFVLQEGLSTPPQIAKNTGIARTNCYHILQSLKEKHLLTTQRRGTRTAYLARDPQALYEKIESQRHSIEELLPDLRALYSAQQHKPSIQFFEGFEEVKQIYYSTLRAEKILAIGSTKQLAHLDANFYTHYIAQIKKRHIIFDDILSYDSGEKAAPQMKRTLKGLYDMKFLPKQTKELATDILIWDNSIALLTLEDPVFGTVITNQSLAETFRTMFQVFWERL